MATATAATATTTATATTAAAAAAPPQNGAEPPPQFLVHFYWCQTAGCTKMPLSMELGLRPGDFVLDGDPAPLPKKGAEPPKFSARLLWPNGWMDQDGTWYGDSSAQATLCSMGTQLPPAQRAHPPPPSFWSMFTVAKRLDG